MMRCKAYVGSENSNGHHSMYPTNLKLKEPRILPKDISRDIIRQIELEFSEHLTDGLVFKIFAGEGCLYTHYLTAGHRSFSMRNFNFTTSSFQTLAISLEKSVECAGVIPIEEVNADYVGI